MIFMLHPKSVFGNTGRYLSRWIFIVQVRVGIPFKAVILVVHYILVLWH